MRTSANRTAEIHRSQEPGVIIIMEQSKIDISDVYNQANAVTIKASLSICTLALRNGCLCLLVWSKRALASYYV